MAGFKEGSPLAAQRTVSFTGEKGMPCAVGRKGIGSKEMLVLYQKTLS